MRIPRAGVGKNYLIPRLEPVYDLNGVHRAFAQLHRSTHSFRTAVDQLEHSHGVVFLAESRTPYVNDVVQMFELDGSVDAEIWPRAFRQRLIKRDIDRHRPLLHCRIDSRNVAVCNAIASIDDCFLADLNV